MSELRNDGFVSDEDFTVRPRASGEKPVTELDAREQMGLIQRNISTLPQRIKESQRSPEALARDEARLKAKGDTGPSAIPSTLAETKTEARPEPEKEPEEKPSTGQIDIGFDAESEKAKSRAEAKADVELNPAVRVGRDITRTAQGFVFGVAEPTEADKILMDEEVSPGLEVNAGAISMLEFAAMVGSYAGKFSQDTIAGLISLSPAASALAGKDIYGMPKAIGRDIESKLNELFVDYAGDASGDTFNLLSENSEAINSFFTRVGEDVEKTLKLDYPKDKEALKIYQNFKKQFQVPYADSSSVIAGAAIAGSFLPFAGILGIGRAASLGAANLNKGLLVASAIKNVGIQTAIKNLPLRQIFNLNLARQTIPDPLMNLIKGSNSFKAQVAKRYSELGMSREKALQVTMNAQRDAIAAIGAGSAYGIAQEYAPELGPAGQIGISIVGSLIANKSVQLGKDATFGSLALMLGKLGKEDGNTSSKIFNYLKNSPNQKSSFLRKTVLRGMGYTESEITQLRRQAIETGNKTLSDIRNASSPEDKARILQDAKNKNILLQDGRVNEYHQMEMLASSVFDRNTMDFAATFWQKVNNMENPKVRQEFQDSIASVFQYMDGLSQKYPDSMKSFVLLLENAAQISVLNSLRQSLLTKAEFSSKKGGFVSGSLERDIDKYGEALKSNIASLKSVVNELKGTPDKYPEILTRLAEDLGEGLVKPVFARTAKRIEAIKAHAASQLGREREELFELTEKIQIMSGLNRSDDPEFINEISKTAFDLFKDTFANGVKVTNRKFNAIKEKHADVEIDITDALGVTPTAETLDSPIRLYLKRFGDISPSLAKKLQDDLSTNFFNKHFGPAVIDTATGEVNVDKALNLFKDNVLERSKGTVEQKEAILERLANAVDSAQGNDAKLLAIKESFAEIDEIPAVINVSSFMDLRSELVRKQKQYFDSNEFKKHNDVYERIQELDNTIAQSPTTKGFKVDYADAREFYRENLGRFNDKTSPFNKFVFNKDVLKEDQLISSFKLFDRFVSGPNMDKNVSDFQKAFQDPATGEYNQQAIQQLIFAFSRKGIPDYTGIAEPVTIRKMLIENITPYRKVLEDSGNGEFVEALEKVASYRTSLSEATKEQQERIAGLFQQYADRLDKNIQDAIQNSAVQQFSETQLSAVGAVLKEARNNSRTLLQRGDLLFGLSGRSVQFPAYDNYMAIVKNSQEYQNLNLATREKFDNIINSKEFKDQVDALSVSRGDDTSMQTVMETILKDVEQNSPKMLAQTREDFKAIVFDRMADAMFPATKSYTKTPKELSKVERLVYAELSAATGKSQREVAFELSMADAEMVNRARTFVETTNNPMIRLRGSNNIVDKIRSGRFGRGFKFNLDNELDPISMQKFYDENEKLFDLLLDDQHKEAVDELMGLSIVTGSKMLSDAMRDLPAAYTTQMALGRTYNAMKGVVSWRYLVMEKVITDYRVAQSDIMKSLLSDKNTAVVMRDILSRGLFKPRQFRQAAKYWLSRLVPFGYRLRPGGMDKMEKDFERLSQVVSQELEEKEEN